MTFVLYRNKSFESWYENKRNICHKNGQQYHENENDKETMIEHRVNVPRSDNRILRLLIENFNIFI